MTSAVASDSHTFAAPPLWVVRWTAGPPADASVLDVVCDSGRHVRWLAARDLRLTDIDRDAAALSGLTDIVETTVAGIEGGPWPLPAGAIFDTVTVTNYLHRPFWSRLLVAAVPGGRLVYETSTDENETVGKPLNLTSLLTPGGLLDAVRDPIRMIGYEGGSLASPRGAYLQRICAVHEPSEAVVPRYTL